MKLRLSTGISRRRAAIGIIAIILIGMLANYIVGWGAIIIWSDAEATETWGYHPGRCRALFDRFLPGEQCEACEAYVWARDTYLGFDSTDAECYESLETFESNCYVICIRSGWPLRSLEGAYASPRLGESGMVGLLQVPDALQPSLGRFDPELPWIPMGRGTVVNTIIYSTLMVLMAYGVLIFRAAYRRRRRRCIRCGHRLIQTQLTCPECGYSVV